ncbi:MAG TPA: TfoX/Sxy family protein [Gemmataceae bacterium]|jgi:hypothetical protein
MAYDATPAERIRQRLARRTGIEEKTLFGCACFLLGGNVLVGVWRKSLIVRLGSEEGEEALKEAHIGEFDITGRPMKCWVLIGPKGIEDDEQLTDWIERATRFVRTLPAKEE